MEETNESPLKTMESAAFPSIIKKERDFDEISIGSDVSYELVEPSTCQQRLKGFLLHLIAATIVIGACCGALIWSFSKGEAGANEFIVRDASKNFTIFIDEYTTYNGNYSLVFRKAAKDGTITMTKPIAYPSWWYQDNTNQRLVHRKDNITTLYAFKTYSYWATYNKYNEIVSCRFDLNMNYNLYIQRLGLSVLNREHSEYETTAKFAKVFVYNGDPSEVLLEGTPQDAFLVTAYADAHTGALLGWDTYFTHSNSSSVYEMSYWYDSMYTPSTSPPANLFDVPTECEPFEANKNRVEEVLKKKEVIDEI